jgi:hypothetical protein
VTVSTRRAWLEKTRGVRPERDRHRARHKGFHQMTTAGGHPAISDMPR